MNTLYVESAWWHDFHQQKTCECTGAPLVKAKTCLIEATGNNGKYTLKAIGKQYTDKSILLCSNIHKHRILELKEQNHI